jgi:ABC-type transport system involved in multi-copper enzyme maturation permease subunit
MSNPVLWLELRIRIRERKLWIVTCLYLLCLFGIAAIAITQAAETGLNNNPSQTGMTVYSFGNFSLLGLLVILGPLASAGSISQEREQRTLPALLNTPMSPLTIVLGKLLAAWAFIFWLALLSLPFLALGEIWGAIHLGRMIAGLGLAIAAGLVSSAIAVGLSGYFRRSLTSYLATGAVMFLWIVVWPIFGVLTENFLRTAGGHEPDQYSPIYYIFFYHHPVAPLFFLIATADNPTSPGLPQSIIPFALAVWAVISILFILLACRGLRRTPAGRN